MIPGSLTATEKREAVLASLAHDTLKSQPPDPTLQFVVNLGLHRRPIRRNSP